MTITLKNSKNQTLALTESNGYALTDAQGLSPAPSNVNITKTAGGNGSLFNSAMIPQRNIVLTVYMLPNIEARRNALYAFLSPNSDITLLISETGRTAQISGIVEAFDGTFFTAAEMFSISILCPQPFFEKTTATTAVITEGANTINNSGDYATGFEMSVKVKTAATDLIISDGASSITLDGDTFAANDVITICTKQGAVYFKKNGTSILNLVSISNGLPKLKTGANTVTVTNGYDGSITFTELYGGI